MKTRRKIKAEKDTSREEARRRLRKWLKPGGTVYVVYKYVARSGMSRHLTFFTIKKNRPIMLSGNISDLLGLRWLDDDSLAVGGCGFDVGYSVVTRVARILWPDGFTCIGEGCPSNDHDNGDRNHKPHHHRSGDYALRHAWL